MIIQDYVIKLHKLIFMKNFIFIPFFILGTTSLIAQTSVKRSNLELKETIIKTDTKVKETKEIEIEKNRETTILLQKIATLPKKVKTQK